MRGAQILDKIDQLQAKFTGPAATAHANIFKAWRDEAGRALLLKDLGDHTEMKRILRNMKREIQEMELILKRKSDKLPDRQRDNILDRKELYESFISNFVQADNSLAQVEKQVDEAFKLNP